MANKTDNNLVDTKLILEKHLPQLSFCSAGTITYAEDGRKLVKGDVDNTPIHPKTNTLKAQLDAKYIVIDSDGADLTTLRTMFPSIDKTFATRTTKNNKRHFYFLNSSNVPRTRTTGLDADGPFDIITQGIMFEGHTIPGQETPWKIIQTNNPIELTPEELKLVHTLIRKDDTKLAVGANRAHAFFLDNLMLSLVEKVLEAKTFGSKSNYTLTVKEHNALLKSIQTYEFREQHKGTKKRIAYPALSYTVFNTIAYKLSYNAAITTEQRDEFIDLVLKEQYEVDPESQQTYQRLHKQILPNLPTHNKLTHESLILEDLPERLAPTVVDGWGVVKFIHNKDYYFLEINSTTMLPRIQGNLDGIYLSASAICSKRGYSKEDLELIPWVKIVDDPFQPRSFYDDENDVDVINLSRNSKYVERAIPIQHMPDNPLTRLIQSYCGEYTDLYMHWLAHALYNKRPPQTILALISPPEDMGGTGKSSLAQAIPTRLIYASATVDIESTERGWGDAIYGKKLVCFNDMKELTKDKWGQAHAFMRDRTTGGARRWDNMKYGGFVATTNTVAFSMSANFIPQLDEHDRRFLVILPQMIYGKTEMLSDEDAIQVNEWLEHTHLDTYIEEFQALANYLLYLFKKHRLKYHNELYNRAPDTQGRKMCIANNRTYSESIPNAIQSGPQALEDLIGKEKLLEYIPFLTLQYQNKHIALPWDFFAMILADIHGDVEVKHTKAKVAKSMRLTPDKFKNQSDLYKKFKNNPDELKRLGMPTHWADFTVQMYKFPVDEKVVEAYKTYFSEN